MTAGSVSHLNLKLIGFLSWVTLSVSIATVGGVTSWP